MAMKITTSLIILLLVAIVAVQAHAQSTPASDAPDLRHNPPPPDSTPINDQYIPAPVIDSTQKYLWRSDFFHSPTSMLLRSIVVPGWGQWTNGKKQKAAIVVAVEGYFFTKALIWRGRALDRAHTWENSCLDGTCDNAAFNDYSSARDKRNYFYWLTGFTVFISMFDAYADAYLLSLERTENKGDRFWGGHADLFPDDEYRLVATIKF